MNVQTINDNVRTFCFFILRATPWCWPPPAPYQRRRHLSCRSSRGHWSSTVLADEESNTSYTTAPGMVSHSESRIHPPSVQHGGHGLPTHPSHDLQTNNKNKRSLYILSVCYMYTSMCIVETSGKYKIPVPKYTINTCFIIFI